MKTQNEILQAIDGEPANLGKLDLRLFESNPDIVRDKLEEKIHMLLEKYGYGFKLLSFRWRDNGVPEAEVIVEKKPDVPLEDRVATPVAAPAIKPAAKRRRKQP